MSGESKRAYRRIAKHFAAILDGDDDLGSGLAPIEIAFMDSFFEHAHATGHECERDAHKDGAPREVKPKRKRRVTKENFFREMGIEPPESKP